MPKLFELLFILNFYFYNSIVMAATNNTLDEHQTVFSGRISRINDQASLVRLKTNFKNMKFLNVHDRLEFWNASYPEKRCSSYVEARSNEYLLIKIPNFTRCVSGIYMTTGTYLHLYSPDMEKNMKTSNELMKILLKKRIALESKKLRYESDLKAYLDRIDLLNKRYEVLRQKLELEWKNELNLLEEDKARTFVGFKQVEARLNELESKMERYRVHNQNLEEERWSLDPKLYIKK